MRRMYQTMRRIYYWPFMAVEVYAFVRSCTTCARERVKLRKHTNSLVLFPAHDSLEQVAIDLLGPFQWMSRNNSYLLVITDRYTKLTGTVPSRHITARDVARAVTTHWVFALVLLYR